MVRILIGGDVYPIGKVENAFSDGNEHEIFHDLLGEIASADISVVNLECPLIQEETPILKVGEVLGANSSCIKGFAAAGWSILNLANNHIFDHGAKGLRETIDTIKEAGLGFVGAGLSIRDAQAPLVREIDGTRIVIYAMAEREFSIADDKTPGANPLDLINFVNAIRQYKQKGIFIVLIHGGVEYYPYPSPEMVRRCRFMVDMGADAVICCHTHCALPWEIYAERPIVYGLGNLIFESTGEGPEGWNKGYLARLTVDGKCVGFEPIPYCQSWAGVGALKMDEDTRHRFLDEMHKKGAHINDTAFLEGKWLEHCLQQKEAYLAGLFGYNRLMRKVRSLLLKTLHSRKEVLRALHLVECEALREVLSTIFRDERAKGQPHDPSKMSGAK